MVGVSSLWRVGDGGGIGWNSGIRLEIRIG